MQLGDDEGVPHHHAILARRESIQSFPDGQIFKWSLFLLVSVGVLLDLQGLLGRSLSPLLQRTFLASFTGLLLIPINEQIIIFGHQLLDLRGERGEFGMI
jgi:hypothetical protein